jgi:formate/nitrite transporter FocA (FNT family)
MSDSVSPEAHDVFELLSDEGQRRLARSPLELGSTALVAGFDVVFGVIALAATSAAVTPHFGPEFGHFAGSLAFGIAFIFIVAGRSELFTENFMVPVAALIAGRSSKRKLVELWTLSPIFNILGGTVLIMVISVHGVLPHGTSTSVVRIAHTVDENSALTAFLSAVAGGALITLMTWIVEGTTSLGGKFVVAWMAGALLALASFNHVIVVTLELIYGLRVGSHTGGLDLVQNFFVAAGGNMTGGLLFVTLTRTGQAIGSSSGDGPIDDAATGPTEDD